MQGYPQTPPQPQTLLLRNPAIWWYGVDKHKYTQKALASENYLHLGSEQTLPRASY